MGCRIQVSFHEKDASTTPAALLHANCHYDDIDLDGIAQKAVQDEKTPSHILAALLSAV